MGAVAAALLALPAVASAQGVPAPEITLGGHLYPRPFGLTYVYGRLRVPDGTPQSALAGQTVVLYESFFPFTVWNQVATLTSDWEGYVIYHTSIGQNASFRAIWQGATPLQSNDKLVKLPLKVSMRARRTSKKVVTFSGVTTPAHPGARVYVQLQSSRHGGFHTRAGVTLGPSSTFRTRMRLKRGGVYRVLFKGDGQYGAAASRPVRVR